MNSALNFLFPERKEYDYSLFLAEQRDAIRPLLFWGGFMEILAWVPYLLTDLKLFPQLTTQFLILRLALSATGIIIVIASFIPTLSRHSFFWGNLGFGALLQLVTFITLMVRNDPRYIAGYVMALFITVLFPMPFFHMFTQIMLALIHYIVLAHFFQINLLALEQRYTFDNLLLAHGVTLIMLYTTERARLKSFVRKMKLEETQAALRLRNEQMEQDMDMGQEIQMNLMPQEFPVTDAVEMQGYYQSMESVGGDYYEVLSLYDVTARPEDEERYIIILVDASGHGVPAAMISSMTKISFRHAIMCGVHRPDRILKYINSEVIQYLLDEHYLTAFVMLMDLHEGVMHYSNGGHRPVLSVGEDGVVTRLDTVGEILGMFEDAEYEMESAPLEKEQLLLFYTDGIVEATNARREEFGDERLEKSLLDNRSDNVQEMLLALFQNVKRFTGGALLKDDITLLLARVKSPKRRG